MFVAVAALACVALVPSADVVVAVPSRTVSLSLPATALESRTSSSATTVGATGQQDATAAEARVRFSYTYSDALIFGSRAERFSVVTVAAGTVVRLCRKEDGDGFKNPDTCERGIVEFHTTSPARVGGPAPSPCPSQSTSCPADPAEVGVVSSIPGSAGNLGAFAVADGSYGEATVGYDDGTTRSYPISALVVTPVEGGRDGSPVVTEDDLARAREEVADAAEKELRTDWPDYRIAGIRAHVDLKVAGEGTVTAGMPGPVGADAIVQSTLIGYREQDLSRELDTTMGDDEELLDVAVRGWRRDAPPTDPVPVTVTITKASAREIASLIRGRSRGSGERRLRAIDARVVSSRPDLPVRPFRLDIHLAAD